MSAALTFRVKDVSFVTPPPAAATVIGKLPTAVELLALIVNNVEQAGLQEGAEKEAVAPAGRPETEKETAWLLPDTSVVTIVLLAADPGATDRSPELASEKSNAT